MHVRHHLSRGVIGDLLTVLNPIAVTDNALPEVSSNYQLDPVIDIRLILGWHWGLRQLDTSISHLHLSYVLQSHLLSGVYCIELH
ncbi:unnamed protein product [Onchocerca flexuosa]|uniref:Secreted protein n=1 Tax=Onchocerca flexuosa TaxID=387005 RepID=A0A183H3H1_9BILA|nr:unnamed protein product [Onchocerca flexuosa]